MLMTRMLRQLYKNFTAYHLFAITIIAMVFGHAVAFLHGNNPIFLRIPDRILLPVFLISVGFNSGFKPGKVLWTGAVIVSFLGFFLFGVVRLYIPGVILILMFILEPFMRFLVRDKFLFWGVSLFLALLMYHSQYYFEFGTMAVIFAMAGWLNVNRADVSWDVVKPWQYFIFTYLTYMIFVRIELPFSLSQSLFFALALAFVMVMLLDFRTLLLNSFKCKPKSYLDRFFHYIGHRSMLIYFIQQIFFFISFYYLNFIDS